jgi:hypothetical protein
VKGTLNYGCRYTEGTGKPYITGYSDSDLAGDIDDRKSTTGMVFFMEGSIVTWASEKQKVVALSSCEAEYIAASTAACQAVWLSKMLSDIQGVQPSAVSFMWIISQQLLCQRIQYSVIEVNILIHVFTSFVSV